MWAPVVEFITKQWAWIAGALGSLAVLLQARHDGANSIRLEQQKSNVDALTKANEVRAGNAALGDDDVDKQLQFNGFYRDDK